MGLYEYNLPPRGGLGSACNLKGGYLWDAWTTLDFRNPTNDALTCVGWAPSQGRRCRNPVNMHNRARAQQMLEMIASMEPDADALYKHLRSLAGTTLCLRNHQNQVDEMTEKWMRTIRTLQPVPKEQSKRKVRKGAEDSRSTTSNKWDALLDVAKESGDPKLVKWIRRQMKEERECDKKREKVQMPGTPKSHKNRDKVHWSDDESLTGEDDDDETTDEDDLTSDDNDSEDSTSYGSKGSGSRQRKREEQADKQKKNQRREQEETRRREAEEAAERKRKEQEREQRAQAARERQRRQEKERQEELERKERKRQAEERRREKERQEEEERRREKERQEKEERERQARNERVRQRAEEMRKERERVAKEKAEQEREEWSRRWEQYLEQWKQFQEAAEAEAETETTDSETPQPIPISIPWPCLSGQLSDLRASTVSTFFLMGPASAAQKTKQTQTPSSKCKLFDAECRKWHPDKQARLFRHRGQQRGEPSSEAEREVLNMIARVVARLRSEAREERRREREREAETQE